LCFELTQVILSGSVRTVRQGEDLRVRGFEYTGYASRVIFGVGAADGEGFVSAVEQSGARRIMLVAAEAEGDLAARITGALEGAVVARFSQVRPHVPVEVAGAAVAMARHFGADSLLSVGGGSTTGTAKTVALELGLPIIAVPTTYAGSEVTPVWGLTEHGRKTTGVDLKVLPQLVIYDPALTISLPVQISVVSGLNALAHCVEAFWTPMRNPITSLLAEEGIRALAGGLPGVASDPRDVDARSQTLYGAWLAGTAFATAGSDLHHKICHALGGAYDLPHAETHAVVLPYATAVAAPRVADADQRIASALDAPDLSAAEAIYAFERQLGAPRSLREIGLSEGELDAVAELIGETLSALPDPVSRSASETLLRAAFHGSGPVVGVGAR
jgi:maleylacetate reductase